MRRSLALTAIALIMATSAHAASLSNGTAPAPVAPAAAPQAMAPTDHLSIGTPLGTTTSTVVETLTQQGYQVTEVEQEHGMIEVSARKDGRRVEIKVSPETGQIVRLEGDDS